MPESLSASALRSKTKGVEPGDCERAREKSSLATYSPRNEVCGPERSDDSRFCAADSSNWSRRCKADRSAAGQELAAPASVLVWERLSVMLCEGVWITKVLRCGSAERHRQVFRFGKRLPASETPHWKLGMKRLHTILVKLNHKCTKDGFNSDNDFHAFVMPN